jgi:hypothetical protein
MKRIVQLFESENHRAAALAFVEAHRFEALFLLSNLQEHGWALRDSQPTSMNVWACLGADNSVAWVLGLCANRNVLVVAEGEAFSEDDCAHMLRAMAPVAPKMFMGKMLSYFPHFTAHREQQAPLSRCVNSAERSNVLKLRCGKTRCFYLTWLV